MAAAEKSSVSILGVRVDAVNMQEAVEMVEGWLEGASVERGGAKRPAKSAIEKSGNSGKYQIVTPNPEHLMLAQRDTEFRKILNAADLSIADGSGVVWASRFLGTPLPERVTGTDLMIALCKRAAAKGWRVSFLGGEKGVAHKAARQLREWFPGLKVASVSSANPTLPTSALRLLPSDFLFVAYGAPAQEKWIARNLARLPVKVAMGVGGGIDFVAGKQKRAPLLMRSLSLEWLWRLVADPRRFRRILTAVVLFPLAVARYRWKVVEYKKEKGRSGMETRR